MKKNFAVINLALMAFVLLTIACQSLHVFSHSHIKELHAHDFQNVFKPGKQAITTFENHDNDCFICDFHFDFFTAPQHFSYRLYFPFKPIPYTLNAIANGNYFAGSLFALRAPPVLI